MYVSPKIVLVKLWRKVLYQHRCNDCWEKHYINKEPLDCINPLFCENCWVDEEKINKQEVVEFYSWYQVIWSKVNLHSISDVKRKIWKKRKNKLIWDYAGVCQYCYEYFWDNLEIDHIIPYCGWWSNELSNLTVACKKCNNVWSDKLFNNFFEKQEYIARINY